MAIEPSTDEGRDEPVSALRERLARLADPPRRLLRWSAAHRLKAGILATVGAASVGSAVLLWVMLLRPGPGDFQEMLNVALEALDDQMYEEARELAGELESRAGLPVEQLGGPAFVLGAIAAYEAEEPGNRERDYYLLGARYLEEARDRGFPPGRRGEGLFLLGKSLYLSGQVPASRPILRQALKADRPHRAEIHRLLAGAYFNDAKPNFSEALKHNTLFLKDRMLSAARRHQGLLQRARIFFRQDKIPQCLGALEKIPPEAKNWADAIIIRGQVLVHQARSLKNKPKATREDKRKALQKYQVAIKTLRFAQGTNTLDERADAKAMYLLGTCFLEAGDERAAWAQFDRIRTIHADSPEAWAADLQQAELARRLGRDKDAVAGYRRVLDAVTDPDYHSNPWITLDQLRTLSLAAYQGYLDSENFAPGLQLIKSFYPLFSRTRTMQMTAEAHRAWGQSLLGRADHLPPSEARPLQRRGRAQMRHAAVIHARLAKLRVATRQYPDDLWRSAESCMAGHDYRNAVRVLKQYLDNESRRRHPQALVFLGEALLALEQHDEALAAFRECIEFHPRAAPAFRARLLASRAHLEKGEPDPAQALLEENLNGDFLTPASKEWRDSIFALGQLFYMEGRDEEAIERLEEAVGRFPDSPPALEGRYAIANSYRRSAQATQEKLKADLVHGTRVALSKKVRALLTSALGYYRQVRETLMQRQETTELTRQQQSILRNCYFAVGNVLFDMNEYKASINSYSIATNRYQDRPEVLEAYVQISRAYQKLEQPLEARTTLEQAKVVLARMKNETPFEKTTNYTRSEWIDHLDWLSTL